MSNSFKLRGLNRREVVGLLAPPLLASLGAPCHANTAVPLNQITVMYRRGAGPGSPGRLDAVVQAAALAIEREMLEQRFRVLQASAAAHAVLDQGPEVIVVFDPSAGFSMVFSIFSHLRPIDGSDRGIAEVRLAARVFVGQSVVALDESRGQQMLSMAAETREFGERRALEVAAGKAAKELCARVALRLTALSPDELQALAQPVPQVLPNGTVVAVPRPMPMQQTLASTHASADITPPLAPRRRFALLVGVSDYAPVRQRWREIKPADLRGVADDLRNLPVALQRNGFAANDIKILSNDKATSASVRLELMRLAGTVQAEDLVVIAISAHGAPKNYGPSGYGAPILSDYGGPDDGNAIDFWQLQGLVANLPAQQAVLLVDTCHAGGAAKSMPSAIVAADGLSVRTGNVAPEPARITAGMDAGRHVAVLVSSRAEEVSLEDPPNGGLFTSRLLRGLAASQGRMPLDQLFKEHLQPVVMRDSEVLCRKLGACKVQTPMFAFSGRGNLIRL